MGEYPVQMVHPKFAPAIISGYTGALGNAVDDAPGRPARFPPVTVETEDQEEQHRARGYLRLGEAAKTVDGYHAYPKILRHPEHEEKTPDETHATNINGHLNTYVVKGNPGKYPDQIVRDEREEDVWRAKGYVPAGAEDPISFGRAVSAPGFDGEEDAQAYPRWNEATQEIEEDPDAPPPPDHRMYPKWIITEGFEDELAKDAAEERKILKARGIEMRGSSKNEPTKRETPAADDPEWLEFQAWKRAQAAQAALDEASAAPDVDELRSQAEELGVEVDKRWSAKTLQEKIDAKLEAAE